MNKNIVITGGSSGIGLELSKIFINAGHTVFILSRKSSNIGLKNSRCFRINCDITDIDNINESRVKILEILLNYSNTKIDLLINCAGVGYEKKITNINVEDYNVIFNTNVKGLVFTTKEFIPFLNKDSLICNISSIAGIKGFSGWSIYSASKFAVEGFTESIRHELRHKKIKVISVRLGSVNTPFYKHLSDTEKGEFMNTEETAKLISNILFTDEKTVVENIFINNAAGDL